MATVTWATIDDVFNYTGATITDAQLGQVAGVMDMAIGRTQQDVTRIGSRDLYWLKLATCYQAAWMLAQLDYFTRIDQLTQGHSSTLTTFPPGAMVVGPVAKRALKRVSWLKSRSLHVRSGFQDNQAYIGMDPLSPGTDSLFDWIPMEGA